MAYFSYSKDFEGVADVFLRTPDFYLPIVRFIAKVMTGDTELSTSQRELIATCVSRVNGCAFCIGIHNETLRRLGAAPAVIEAISSGGESSVIDKPFKAVLRFAESLAREPDKLGQEDVDRVISAGWKESTVEQVINIVATFSYVNRLVDAFGIRGREDYYKHVGAMLADRGYEPFVQMLESRVSRSTAQ